MIAEVLEVQRYFKEKFGNDVKDGTYAMPIRIKGIYCFQKIIINNGKIGGFDLFFDKELTKPFV